MTTFQKVIKYLAIALAIFLIISIIGGILGAVGIFGGFFGGDNVLKEFETYSVSSDVNKLDIEISAADLYFKVGDSFAVESNLKNLKVSDNNGVLRVKETKKLIVGDYDNAMLTIYLPSATVLETVNLTTGAGRVTIEELSVQKLDFSLGAGDVSIKSLVATGSADIEGGAGRITISGGALNNLEMDMGLGELSLTSALSGECDLDMGVGKSNITLVGSKDDYSLEIERGIGSVLVEGMDVSDFGIGGNRANKIDISGGVGSINVNFTEE